MIKHLKCLTLLYIWIRLSIILLAIKLLYFLIGMEKKLFFLHKS